MSRFYYRPGHPAANERGFVAAEHMDVEDPSVGLQISVDRNYENQAFTDGTVVNSRRQYKAYCEAHGVTHMSDFTETWKQKQKEREAIRTSGGDQREQRDRREALGRAIHQQSQRRR